MKKRTPPLTGLRAYFNRKPRSPFKYDSTSSEDELTVKKARINVVLEVSTSDKKSIQSKSESKTTSTESETLVAAQAASKNSYTKIIENTEKTSTAPASKRLMVRKLKF